MTLTNLPQVQTGTNIAGAHRMNDDHEESLDPGTVPVTAAGALFTYYDIESLNNVFTLATYTPRNDRVDVFHLVDDDGSPFGTQMAADGLDKDAARERIIAANPAYTGSSIGFFDLSTWQGNRVLATMMGLSDAERVNDPQSRSSYGHRLRPVCDTDPGYDPVGTHPYLAGYNSSQYDTTMLALYLMEAFAHLPPTLARGARADHGFAPARASDLRGYNDELFSSSFRDYMPRYLTDGRAAGGLGWDSVPHRIRAAMISSGRHLDVARLNELQRFVGLKRLLGGMGRQILESGQLGAHNATVRTNEDLLDLMAYNVSDVIGLHKLFEHPTYSNAFDLKNALLAEYPETVYERRQDAYAPDVRPSRTRRNRLTPDSTSARFVSLILAPYAPLKDMPVVSFDYPCAQVAAARGVEPVNVLAQCREFFYGCVTDPGARARFDLVHDYYTSIENKNFNDSSTYAADYPEPGSPGTPAHPVHVLREIPKAPNNLPYFNADGTASNCFATFSTGGIHGAETDQEAFAADLAAWEATQAVRAEVMATYPDPLDMRRARQLTLADGRVVTWDEVITARSVISSRSGAKDLTGLSQALAGLGEHPGPQDLARVTQEFAGIGYKPARPRPELFAAKDDGSTRLRPRYAYTSAARAIHEDFVSYYPNLLRNMGAFANPELGMDRYAKIFFDKERYGQEMKRPGITREEKKRLQVLREGTKLILNTASGAGDTTFGSSPIRMNNTIIAMRIIGQLFTWRVGQAQTTAGARIISTNTDGLYSVLDTVANNRVLAEQSAAIGIDIEPEELLIVSKDSNNRLELKLPADPTRPDWEATIESASGASLACHEEPLPTKSLAHPAVLDWALARYLRYVAGGYTPPWRTTPLSLDEPLDVLTGKQLMHDAIRDNPPVLAARLFQNVLAASVAMITHPFAADPVDPVRPDPGVIENPRPLQHYNRIFVVHAGKPGAVSLRTASAHVVNAASRLKRRSEGRETVTTDAVALRILSANGFAREARSASAANKTLLPPDQDVGVRKVPGIDPAWSVLIDNRDLLTLPEAELRSLLGCLDIDVYVQMLASAYDKNWKRSSAASDTGDEEEED